MENNYKVILHIVFDGILFDGVSNRFDQMIGYKNIFLLNVYGVNLSLKYIENGAKVVIAKDEEEWGNIINDPNIDIIYFHGLWAESAKAVKFITNKAIVIWWCYGMDIYENVLGIAPLVPIKLYKPKTFWLVTKRNIKIHRFTSGFLSYFFPKAYNYIMRIKYPERTKSIYRMAARMDYLFTPLPLEYDEVKRYNNFITAKPFRLYNKPTQISCPVQHSSVGNILVDHSANITNNHIDIFHKLKKVTINRRTLIIPISYGVSYIQERIKQYNNFKGAETIFLENPIPFIDYVEILKSCSHAIFGGIRQTGLGNIFLCLRLGVKVFLFKDSITYKYLKKTGYRVFAIEQELNDTEISIPLDNDSVMHNYNLYHNRSDISHGTYEQQFDYLIEESKKCHE